MITILLCPPRALRIALRVFAAAALLLWLALMLAPSAGAQVDSQVEPFIDVHTVLLLLGVVTPFATALLARTGISYATQSALSALLTALVAYVVTALESGDLTWQKFVNGWVQIGATHLVSWLATKPAVDVVRDNTPGLIGPR